MPVSCTCDGFVRPGNHEEDCPYATPRTEPWPEEVFAAMTAAGKRAEAEMQKRPLLPPLVDDDVEGVPA